MSPSSTPDDTGDYGGYGVEGQQFPYHGTGATASDPNLGLAQCITCATEGIVTPHASFIALDSQPQAAYANIQRLRRLYPGVYGPGGFFDAVDPSTGAVGHRYLVLDQSMIMASLANALENRSMQRHFAVGPDLEDGQAVSGRGEHVRLTPGGGAVMVGALVAVHTARHGQSGLGRGFGRSGHR